MSVARPRSDASAEGRAAGSGLLSAQWGRARILLAVPLLVALTTACRKRPWPEGPPATEAERMAQTLWVERCTPCHGATGRGDGPLSASLKTRPQDFSDPVWQKEDPDDHLELVILLGGPAAGYSAEMPPNPDLSDRPEVVRALVKKIRSLGK